MTRHASPPRASDAFSDPAAVLRALDKVGGAVLVLDPELRVVTTTPSADRLLGERLPVGALAPKLLCGGAVDRPIAEALAMGRPASATIPRPGPAGGGELFIHVRAIPLGEDTRAQGWVLLLDEGPPGALGDASPVEFHGMLTCDPAMKRMFHIVEKAAKSEVSVLVRGETGSGKELVARALHALSPRHKGPLRAINCAALPPNLLESELFGHVRGAFTGAVRDDPGHIRSADKGTLFLDEVGEMPLDLQAKLLRVIETRSVLPVGGREPVPVDTRIVAATHRALRKEVEAGRFRADLMFRLRVVPIFLPPLRARPGDVLLLAQRFIDVLNAREDRKIERIAPGVRVILERHDWPGNVRELRNVLEYAFVIGEGPVLVETDLPPELSTPDGVPGETAATNVPPQVPRESALSPEAARILRAIERVGGNRARAAKMLGMSRVTLWRRMRALGLETS